MTHTPGFFDFFIYIMLVLATLLAQSQSAPINPRFYAFSSYIGPVVNLTFDDPAVLRVVSNDSRHSDVKIQTHGAALYVPIQINSASFVHLATISICPSSFCKLPRSGLLHSSYISLFSSFLGR